jgi:hypothetical protein
MDKKVVHDFSPEKTPIKVKRPSSSLNIKFIRSTPKRPPAIHLQESVKKEKPKAVIPRAKTQTKFIVKKPDKVVNNMGYVNPFNLVKTPVTAPRI